MTPDRVNALWLWMRARAAGRLFIVQDVDGRTHCSWHTPTGRYAGVGLDLTGALVAALHEAGRYEEALRDVLGEG